MAQVTPTLVSPLLQASAPVGVGQPECGEETSLQGDLWLYPDRTLECCNPWRPCLHLGLLPA